MPDNIIFYIVFLSQILLISYYYPNKIFSRMRYVLQKFPAEDYPKLYPKSLNFYEKGHRRFKRANQFILIVGLVVFFALAIWDNFYNGRLSDLVPVIFFLFQTIPLIILELSECAYHRLMRKADVRTRRKAELHPRRLFDFISAKFVALAVFLIFACVLLYYNFDQFSFDFSNDTLIIIISLAASNLLYSAVIFWNLYGKQNPYQASKDRIKQIELTVKSMVFMSMAASVYLMIVKVVNEIHLDFLSPVLMSLYFQIIIVMGIGSMLKNLRLEDLDFSVYKKEVKTT